MRPAVRSIVEIHRLHPMSVAETADLATRVAERIEQSAALGFEPAALAAVLQLAQQYLGSTRLPGTTLDLLKSSANQALAANTDTVTVQHVFDTLSQATGLPRSILDDDQRMDLAEVRAFFAARVIGQDEAVSAMVDRIAMLKAGLTDPKRPIGVFLFAGPTGTGKTELAKTLADYLFGSADRMTRLDMSEFQTAESTAKIVGDGGQGSPDSLAERIRKQPFSVVLLDEFEKAHPNSWDLFLQVFDDGRLSDARGREVDFRHTIIILTSNLGAAAQRGSAIGFARTVNAYSEDNVLEAVGRTFRPEFVNRLDKIIVFRPLSRLLMRDILLKELRLVLERRGLKNRDWAVEWEDSAMEFLLDKGFSPEMGARPLRRAIDQHLLAPLAATLVEHRYPAGDQFLFVRSGGESIEVEFVDPDRDEPDGVRVPGATSDLPAAVPGGLAAMILSPAGNDAEKAALASVLTATQAQLASPSWRQAKDSLLAETADAGFWSRPDRFAVFSRLSLIDRVDEAARTAERLFARLGASSKSGHASRDMIARLALQLHLVGEGIADVEQSAPVDALLKVERALDAGGDAAGAHDWVGRIIQMYRGWAKLRHMQLHEFKGPSPGDATILQIAGFGAFRRLADEAGLHILEGDERDGDRRIVARVSVVAGAVADPPAAEVYRHFAALLSQSAPGTVVRRYRETPAPLVRDSKQGWRSGRLDAVLRGDFDILGEGGEG
jgi:ATP-dependent Clp protease ATP-binding subunit ClpC